jgi:hypothetical protein
MRLATSSCKSACRSVAASLNALLVPLCQCVLSQPVANLHCRSVAPHRTTFPQQQLLQICKFFECHFCEIELLLQSGAHFADLIFQKCSQRDSFLRFWSANRALATVSCTFCLTLPNRDPTSSTPEATLPEQRHRVSRPRVFSPVNSHATARPPNYLMLGGWHEDVVDMMMWLTWWCECWPWPSSVTRKYSN